MLRTTLLAISASLLVASSALGEDEAAKRPLGEIRFVVDVDGAGGVVACALFKRNQWLEKTDKPAFSAIEKKKATCVFRNVPKGLYAISAFHDENVNEKLDTNFLGIPTESWCTSRDASGFMGPPDFDDAKFQYEGGTLVLRAKM